MYTKLSVISPDRRRFRVGPLLMIIKPLLSEFLKGDGQNILKRPAGGDFRFNFNEIPLGFAPVFANRLKDSTSANAIVYRPNLFWMIAV